MVDKHVLIKDWSKPNGKVVKKGTTLTLTGEKFKALKDMGIVKDRYAPIEYARRVQRDLINKDEEE